MEMSKCPNIYPSGDGMDIIHNDTANMTPNSISFLGVLDGAACVCVCPYIPSRFTSSLETALVFIVYHLISGVALHIIEL